MQKIKDILRRFRDDETGGGILVATPFFCIMFIMLIALIFNVALWGQKKQQLQIMSDCASRAGTLAVKKQYAVLESNGKYHVYSELDATNAVSNADTVLKAFECKGLEYKVVEYNPNGFKVPEWSSKDHRYHDKYLTKKEQYYNGDFSVLLNGTIHGVWEDILGLSKDHEVTIYSQSIVTGDVTNVRY